MVVESWPYLCSIKATENGTRVKVHFRAKQPFFLVQQPESIPAYV